MKLDENDIKNLKITSFINCFEKSIDCSRWDCLIKGCNINLSEKSAAIRHLKRKHQSIYNMIQITKSSQIEDEKISSGLTLRVHIDVDIIWDGCIRMIAENGLPLSFVDSIGFKKIIRPYKVALATKGISLRISRYTIKKAIAERASKIRQQIQNETKNSLVAVKLDIASRHNRSVLGICINYSFQNRVEIRTIAMHTLRMAHTARNLFEIVNLELDRINIGMDQIYAVSTDNAKNLSKATQLMNEEASQQTSIVSEQSELVRENTDATNCDETDCNDSCSDNDDEEDSDLDECSYSDQDIDGDIFDEQYYSDLLNNVRDEFNNVPYNNLVRQISCANHCIHLLVTHAIDICPEIEAIIASCRILVKKLRTPTYRNLLFHSKLPAPKLDVVVRWNSIYMMLISLILLKDFCGSINGTEGCENISSMLLTEDDWFEVNEILTVLKPFYIATMKLQSEKTTLSDFFGIWISLEIQMLKLGTGNNSKHVLIANLLDQMKIYQERLLANPVLLANIYLDPRFQSLLKVEQKQRAVEHLMFVNARFQELQKKNEECVAVDIAEIGQNRRSSFDDVQEYIHSLQQGNIETQNRTESPELKAILVAFEKKYSPRNLTFTDFWNERKNDEPELCKLSLILRIVSPTQNTVERGFSALAIIFSPLRTRTGDKILNDILIIRLNPNLS